MVLSVRWHVARSRSSPLTRSTSDQVTSITPRPWPVGITLAVGSPTFTTPSLGSTPGWHLNRLQCGTGLYTWPTPQQTAVCPSVRLTVRAQNATVLNTADVGNAWLILINTNVGQQGVAANQGNHCTMDPVTATVGRSLKTTKSTLGTTVSRGALTTAPTSSQRLSGLELTARERRHSENRPACCGHRYRTETIRICPAFVYSAQRAGRIQDVPASPPACPHTHKESLVTTGPPSAGAHQRKQSSEHECHTATFQTTRLKPDFTLRTGLTIKATLGD